MRELNVNDNNASLQMATHYSDVIMSAMASQITGGCLLNRLFIRRSKKILKLCVTGLCEGNPLVAGGFPSQRASNAKNVYFNDVIMTAIIYKCVVFE